MLDMVFKYYVFIIRNDILWLYSVKLYLLGTLLNEWKYDLFFFNGLDVWTLQMEAFSRTEDFPKIVEAYSRPTRIIRGKEIGSALEVTAALYKE